MSHEHVDDEAFEPLPGLGALTPALETCAQFFQIDPNLVAAAAERTVMPVSPPEEADKVIAGLAEWQRNALLRRVADGDPLVAAELRALIRNHTPNAPRLPPRTGGELRVRAAGATKERAEDATARARQEAGAAAERALRHQRARIRTLAARREAAWDNIETIIG